MLTGLTYLRAASSSTSAAKGSPLNFEDREGVALQKSETRSSSLILRGSFSSFTFSPVPLSIILARRSSSQTGEATYFERGGFSETTGEDKEEEARYRPSGGHVLSRRAYFFPRIPACNVTPLGKYPQVSLGTRRRCRPTKWPRSLSRRA